MINKDFKSNAKNVVDALANYLHECEDGSQKVINQPTIFDIVNDLDIGPLLESGGLTGNKLENFVKQYLKTTTKMHHNRYMAHQVSVPHPTGSLGSFIDGLTNNAMAIYEMGPGATAIEIHMINWMLKKIGWVPAPISGDPKTTQVKSYGSGVMTHGGSLANLTAMITARSAMFPNFWRDGNTGDVVVLVPEQSHYSLKRTIGILGLGEKNCISIPSDEDGRVIPNKLPKLIKNLKKNGKKIMAIVGNACGTAAGLYDPLDEIGAICKEHNIWFHVDAAQGAGAIVCDEYRYLVNGIEKADSVVWDAHKMFRTPVLSAAVLVKNYRHLDNAFTQEASYLVHDKEQPGIDQMMRAVECTKSGLGLKMFMSIAAMGEKGLIDYISSRTKLAVEAAKYIEIQSDIECPVTPETCILCFRIGKNDQRQLEIRKKLLKDGNFYISTTYYKNARWLRCVIINPNTTLDDIKELIYEVRKINTELGT